MFLDTEFHKSRFTLLKDHQRNIFKVFWVILNIGNDRHSKVLNRSKFWKGRRSGSYSSIPRNLKHIISPIALMHLEPISLHFVLHFSHDQKPACSVVVCITKELWKLPTVLYKSCSIYLQANGIRQMRSIKAALRHSWSVHSRQRRNSTSKDHGIAWWSASKRRKHGSPQLWPLYSTNWRLYSTKMVFSEGVAPKLKIWSHDIWSLLQRSWLSLNGRSCRKSRWLTLYPICSITSWEIFNPSIVQLLCRHHGTC